MRDAETLAKCAAFRLRNAGQKTVPLYLAEVAINTVSKWPGPATLDSTNTRNSTANRSNPNSTHSIGDTLCDAVTKWRGPSDISKRGGSQPVEKRTAGGHSVNLEDQAEHWMGPNVPNGGRTASHAEKVGNSLYHGDKKVQLGLEHQAKTWPGPANRDYRGSSEGSSEGSITRQDGKSRADMLDYAAEQFFRPPSSPDQPIAGGSMSSTDGPNSNQPSAKRKLNPIFVEALMRWPTGLSGFERQEMAWTQWWVLMPSFVLALCSQTPAKQGSLFDDAA